jgi:hypothetical protein
MSLDNLKRQEQKVVLECLRASTEGPFFPDQEFSTLFGLSRSEVRSVMDQWPVDDRSDEKAALAINNAINNLLGYPHDQEEAWSKYISGSREEVYAIFEKWRDSPAEGYFDAMR